jgi:multidrug efflux system outer membrane protein
VPTASLTPLWLGLALALALAGCGHAPPPPTGTALPSPARYLHGDGTPAIPAPAAPPATAAWWTVFGQPALDRLVERALQADPRLEAAEARLRGARAALRAADAARGPTLNAELGIRHDGGPLLNDAGGSGRLVQAGVTLAFEPDLSGRLGHAQAAATHDAAEQQALLAGLRLQVQAEVVQTVLRLQALQAERRLAARVAASLRDTLAVVAQRHANGTVGEAERARAQADERLAEAAAAELEREHGLARHALALLLGQTPGTMDTTEAALGEPAPDAAAADATPAAWPRIPAGLPSELLTRRADVRAAQQALQAAHARRGEAHAAAWPRLGLTASGGQVSPTLATLLSASLRAWSVGALLSAPLFDGGAQAAREGAADAELQAHQARYRAQVLRAFKDVEDRLLAIATLRRQAEALAEAHAAATRAREITESRFRHGLSSQLDLQQVQRTAWKAERQWLQAHAAQGEATVGLLQALGGGWDSAR